jgi:hypothetical protein
MWTYFPPPMYNKTGVFRSEIFLKIYSNCQEIIIHKELPKYIGPSNKGENLQLNGEQYNNVIF